MLPRFQRDNEHTFTGTLQLVLLMLPQLLKLSEGLTVVKKNEAPQIPCGGSLTQWRYVYCRRRRSTVTSVARSQGGGGYLGSISLNSASSLGAMRTRWRGPG